MHDASQIQPQAVGAARRLPNHWAQSWSRAGCKQQSNSHDICSTIWWAHKAAQEDARRLVSLWFSWLWFDVDVVCYETLWGSWGAHCWQVVLDNAMHSGVCLSDIVEGGNMLYLLAQYLLTTTYQDRPVSTLKMSVITYAVWYASVQCSKLELFKPELPAPAGTKWTHK